MKNKFYYPEMQYNAVYKLPLDGLLLSLSVFWILVRCAYF